MAVKVTTNNAPREITIDIALSGLAMSADEAQKFADSLRNDMKWRLPGGGDNDTITINLTADEPADADTSKPESSTVEKLDAKAIAALTPAEFKAAKAAGQV